MKKECSNEHLALLLRQRAERTKDVDDRIIFRLAAEALEEAGRDEVEEQVRSVIASEP